jgi:chorismate synthase
MEDYIRDIRKQGDTVGETVTCVIQNVPRFGEPVFDKLHAELGKKAMLLLML